MKDIIEKFQQYITENQKNLRKHRDAAKENNCMSEVMIVEQRIDDLFMIRFRLEQLLCKAGHENLCKLSGFNEKVREKINEEIS